MVYLVLGLIGEQSPPVCKLKYVTQFSFFRRIKANIGTFLQTYMNTHLLDARNHGLSPHTTEMNYDLMAEDLFRYIVKNDLGRCTLLGHSMGGRTVMSFASKYPELVDKLIVVDVSPVSYGPKHYDYHLGLMRDLKKLDLNTIRTRKEAEAEASKYIDVRSSLTAPL